VLLLLNPCYNFVAAALRSWSDLLKNAYNWNQVFDELYRHRKVNIMQSQLHNQPPYRYKATNGRIKCRYSKGFLYNGNGNGNGSDTMINIFSD
jgi:hypothetical protein